MRNWDRTGYLGDTWEWDGVKWSNVTPASGNPSARRDHAMAYDSARQRVVLFGGGSGTWEWDGAIWIDRNPSGTRPSSSYLAMAYDSVAKRVVLFGGSGRDETWEWDGVKWSNVTPASGNPSARENHAMAYDLARQRVVMFGGYNSTNSTRDLGDTWETTGAAASFTTYGSGCLGSAGVPLLNSPSVPWIGEHFIVEVQSMQRFLPIAIMIVGFSRVSIPLSPIGAPGCTLLLVPAIPYFTVPASSGTATLSVNVPNQPLLAGTSFYLQAFVPDRNANAWGIAASNGGHGVLGKR